MQIALQDPVFAITTSVFYCSKELRCRKNAVTPMQSGMDIDSVPLSI
jgi:hypothetical protein